MSTFKTNGAPSQGRRRRSAAGDPIPSPPPPDLDALGAAVERVAADLRALVMLARSAALPPAGRLDEIERLARAHIEELRARLGSRAEVTVTVERVGLS
jgi:hypothetical protein